MDKSCRQKRLDIGRFNGGVSEYEANEKPPYKSAQIRNDRIAALCKTSTVHLSRNNSSENQKKSEGAKSTGKSTEIKRKSESIHLRKSKVSMDFVTFHKAMDAKLNKRYDMGSPYGQCLPTIKELDAQRGNVTLDSKPSITSGSPEKRIRHPTPMPTRQLINTAADRIREAVNKKDSLKLNQEIPKTTVVNPVVVEIRNKAYQQRQEHKIVVKNEKGPESLNDLTWFRRLLPEEYFRKPPLKKIMNQKSILPYKDIPYDKTNKAIVNIDPPNKPKLVVVEDKSKEKRRVRVTEDRLGVVNIDDLGPERLYEDDDENFISKECIPTAQNVVESRTVKLPRLPFERYKKFAKGNISMIESSEDSIVTKELFRPISSGKKYSYERSSPGSKRVLFNDVQKERNKREEERRRNFNKFFSMSLSSKTQDELLKSKDTYSLGRREGLNVLFQRQNDRNADEGLLRKWQRHGKKFFPEVLTEELRYRKQQNRIYSEYLTVAQPARPVPNLYRKPNPSPQPPPVIQPRAPTINLQPRSDIDRAIINKAIEKSMEIEKKEAEKEKENKENKESPDYDKKVKEIFDFKVPTKVTEMHLKSDDVKERKNVKKVRIDKEERPKSHSKIYPKTPKKSIKKSKIKNKKSANKKNDLKFLNASESEKTTANSTIFDDIILEPLEPTINDLTWSANNCIEKPKSTNVYTVQTEHPNVPQFILERAKESVKLSQSSLSDTTTSSIMTVKMTDKSDKISTPLIEKKKRYPQEAQMVKPILLPSLYRKTKNVSLDKKYPVESEPIPPVRLPLLNKKLDKNLEKKLKKIIPKEDKYPIEEALGLEKRFDRGSRNKNRPSVKKPTVDIVPAITRNQNIRKKDIPRKNMKPKAIDLQTDAPAKNSVKRLTLVERLRQRIEARRKAQQIAMMETEFLSDTDKLTESVTLQSKKEHVIGTTIFAPNSPPKKQESFEESVCSTISKDTKSYNVFFDQSPLSWDFLKNKKDRLTRYDQSKREKRSKTQSPESFRELRRCEVSRARFKKAKTAAVINSSPVKRIKPKSPEQPKTAKTYYVGLSREASETSTKNYESDFEDEIEKPISNKEKQYKNVQKLSPKKAQKPFPYKREETPLKTVRSSDSDRRYKKPVIRKPPPRRIIKPQLKRSNSGFLRKRPEWVSSKRVEPTPVEELKVKQSKNKYKHVQPRYLQPKKPKPSSPPTPQTPPRNPRLRTVQSRYLDYTSSLRLTPSIKSLLNRNADKLKHVFPKTLNTRETLKSRNFTPLKKNEPKKSFDRPPRIDPSIDIEQKKIINQKRIFPKNLYDDLYSNKKEFNIRKVEQKPNITNRLKKFDDLLASTQKTFKKKFEFSDVSDIEDQKQFETSFKSILKECDAINDLLTPIIIPQSNNKIERAFGLPPKPETESSRTFPNFLTWKTDYKTKTQNIFNAEISKESSSSFTKGTLTGNYSSDLLTSVPSLTSTEKSKEIIDNSEECLTPDCYCKKDISSTVMTYAVCPSSTGDVDMLSPMSSLPDLTKKSDFSTPKCYCSSLYDLETNSMQELKKKIEEAIVQIKLEKPKLPPLKQNKIKSNSVMIQTDTLPPLMVGKRKTLTPIKKLSSETIEVPPPKKRNLFTNPVDPILEQIRQNFINDKLKLPKKFTPLPDLENRPKCSFCPEQSLDDSFSSTSLSSISGSLPLPWGGCKSKASSPKLKINTQNTDFTKTSNITSPKFSNGSKLMNKHQNINLFNVQIETSTERSPPAEPTDKHIPSILKNTKIVNFLHEVKTKLNNKKMGKMKKTMTKNDISTNQNTRSFSFSGLDTNKMSGSRKFSSDTSIKKIDERFPEEKEQIEPVPLPSVRAKKFSTLKLTTESTTNLSQTTLPTFSCVVNIAQVPLETSDTEKCPSRTPMTSSLEGFENIKPSTNRFEQLFAPKVLDFKEKSIIHIHRTSGVLNVHNIDNSAESFLDSSGSASIANIQGEQTNTKVGHRFFRKPPPVMTELIEIKPESDPFICERSQMDITPHAAKAVMNIHEDPIVPPKEKTETPSDESTDKSTDTTETKTESDTTETSETTESTNPKNETIVQCVLVDNTDISYSVEQSVVESRLKTHVDVSVSVQSLGSIPPLSPSDIRIGGSPRKIMSLDDVRRGVSPNRRSPPKEGYSYFRGEFDPPVRKPKVDSCIQTEKYKKKCAMSPVDDVD